jgi:hypothetical protein
MSVCIIWSSPTGDSGVTDFTFTYGFLPVQWCFCTFRRAGRLHLQSSWRRGPYLVCDARICSHSSSGTLRFSSICCLAWECGEDWREWLCSTLHFSPCFYLSYLLMLVGMCLHYVDFLWNLYYVLVLTIHLCEKNFVSSMWRIMNTNVREFATTFYEFLQLLFDDNANFIVDLLAFPSYTYPTCNWCLALNNSQKIWLEKEKN